MNKVKRLANQQIRRKYRVRNKLKGSGRVRLSVFRSNLYFRAQAIDDTAGNTVAAAWSGELTGDAARGCHHRGDGPDASERVIANHRQRRGVLVSEALRRDPWGQ